MSLTIIQQPTLLEPVYGDINFVVTSSLSASTNMQYVFDTYTVDQLTGTETRRARNKFFPRAVTGYGIFSPNRILENYVNFDTNSYSTGFTSCENSIVKYKIVPGEELDSTLYFSSTTTNGSYVQFNFTSATNLLIGDSIYISKTNKILNSQYEGYHVVNSATTKTLRIDVPYGITASTFETGYVTKYIKLSSGSTITGLTAINFARPYTSGNTNYASVFYSPLTSSTFTSQFLTNYDKDKYISIQDDEVFTLSMVDSGGTVTRIDEILINTYVGNFQAGAYYINSNISNSYFRKDFACGPYNLRRIVAQNDITANFENVFYDGITSYTVLAYNQTFPLSRTAYQYQKFLIEDKCSGFPQTRLCWLNRFGGFDYFTFNLASSKKINIGREEYTKLLNYNYVIKDRGRTVINTNLKTEITLLSNWISEYEASWIEELFTSPEVYICDNNLQKVIPIVLTTKSFEEKTYKKDRLINYEITYELANDLSVQRG